MNFFTRSASLLIFIFFLPLNKLYGQLTTTPVNNANQLAQILVGSGVAISNATLTAASGSCGSFISNQTNLGMHLGILLTTGSVANAIGPNKSPSTYTENGTPGDPDLDATLQSQSTHDACALEFDVFVTSDTLSFSYVFASEEYNEYVSSGYNDIFAFYISGPGFSGKKNIGVIPGTEIPVAVNHVNCAGNNFPQYYICNDPYNPLGGFCDDGQCPTSSSQTTIEYDGFTTVLKAKVSVIPCQTYHLKLVIADVADDIYDSGVFIEAGSLSSGLVSLYSTAAYINPQTNQPSAVEGCLDGQFHFQTTKPVTGKTVIYFGIGGTANNGVDYSSIPDSVVFLPGDSSAIINIHPVNDGINEPPESVSLYLYAACSANPYDSSLLYIIDHIITDAKPDTTICLGNSIELSVDSADSYSWSPEFGIVCTNCQNPIVIPNTTTTYIVTITTGACVATDSVKIRIDLPIPVNAGLDQNICVGDSVQLEASFANFFIWTPITGLSNPTIASPKASPPETTTYVVKGTNTCGTSLDSVTVFVNPRPSVTITTDSLVCPGQPVMLLAGGASTYQWTPVALLGDPSSPNPTAIIFSNTTFMVIGKNDFGCSDTALALVNVFDIAPMQISADTTIYSGSSYQLHASGGVKYQWSPELGLNDPNSADPLATPKETITYTVKVTTVEGCVLEDSVTITVIEQAILLIPSAFSPNGDGHNDVLHLIVRGLFTLDYFYIYNRWGELIFQTDDVSKGWDGTFNGEPQNVGTYVYVVKGRDSDGKVEVREGNITLLR